MKKPKAHCPRCVFSHPKADWMKNGEAWICSGCGAIWFQNKLKNARGDVEYSTPKEFPDKN